MRSRNLAIVAVSVAIVVVVIVMAVSDADDDLCVSLRKSASEDDRGGQNNQVA